MKTFSKFALYLVIFLMYMALITMFACCHAAESANTRTTAPDLFPVYRYDFSTAPNPALDLGGIADAAKQYSATKDANGMQITVQQAGTWRGYWGIGSLGGPAGYMPIFGGERLRLTCAASPGTGATVSVQYLGGETFDMLAPQNLLANDQLHTYDYTLPMSAAGKQICAIWLRIDNPDKTHRTLRLVQFSLDRRYINNRLDADHILQKPPPHNTRVQLKNGAMAITIGGNSVTGLGWGSMISQNIPDQELNDMVGKTDFKMARLVFSLGDPLLGFYPPTWLGPDQFDFSYVDQQMARFLKANAQTKVILCVALDGAKWWTWMHPEAAGVDVKNGIPDYLSPVWQRDSRDAIRQMVAHIQSSSYAGSVVGYQLMNGYTLDCNFEVNRTTPAAMERFRLFLRKKYKMDRALQLAWHDPHISVATARSGVTPEDYTLAYASPGAFPLLTEPARNPAMMDKIEFDNSIYQQVVLNFAHDVKEATQDRAIVGGRIGDFMGNVWEWKFALSDWQQPISRLISAPDFDFFEAQEPYVGRGIADYGSGVPILPPAGMAAHNKLIVIENDVRTYLSDPSAGYGRTPDLPSTIEMQRRIFVNSLVLGMDPYLWQQDYHYNDPSMIADFHRMEIIYERGLDCDRNSGAEIAFVYDKDYRKYFGYDPLKTAPSRGFALFDYLKFTWARAGVPFDQIFLDDLPHAKPYKIYVFVHTVGLTDEQRNMISHVVKKNGRIGIFIWADGAIDGQRIDPTKMSDLVGMKVQISSIPSNWKMTPSLWFQKETGTAANEPMATLAINDASEVDAPNDTFAPAFTVDDPTAQPIALYSEGPLAGLVGVGIKRMSQWTSIYSASVNLSPSLLRYAERLAKVFQYTDTDDDCYINNSFIGFNTKYTHNIHLRLPQSSSLYEVFRDRELPPGVSFDIPVERGKTYLYFRGSKQDWENKGVHH